MKTPKRYLVTSALPYANGPLHIGHIAGAYLPSDIYVRYLRSAGKDVLWVCGSDEYGAAITIQAKREGTTPRAIIDKYHEINKKAFADVGINFDIYGRTSSPDHSKTAQEFFKTLYDKGEFTTQETEQYYDEEFKQFLADRYITGTCPKCSNEGAYGDQCEKCGSDLSPTELINPKSTLSGKTPVLKTTKHWYLPMEKHEGWLKEWIEKGILEGKEHHNPKEWKNQVLGQCKSWIDGGLHSRAMTRDLDWGVPVPLSDAEGKVLYVWLDAPIGYISFTQQWAAANGKNWEDYWKDEGSKIVHFIGKDNIVFHAIIFPIILKTHGDYNLPDNVPANEFLNLEGNKLSTSRNWAVWLHEYLQEFPGKEDVLRYTIGSILPENKDSEFTWKDFQARNNNELVAIFGNFVNRTMVLTHKYFEGKVPKRGALTDYDREVLNELAKIPTKIAANIEAYRFRDALYEAMNVARLGNKYLADTEPWKIIKEDEERVKTILNIALQITANLTIVFEPFLPFSTKKLNKMIDFEAFSWEKAGKNDLLSESHPIREAELLFEKIEDETVQQQMDKLKASSAAKKASTSQQTKAETTFDEFTKMDIRVGTILEAEKIPKTSKLMKLKVDTGIDQRTVVSGIAEYYNAEDIIGKQVSILVNLAPRNLKGVESQGMILMAEDADGKLVFVSPVEKTENGGKIA